MKKKWKKISATLIDWMYLSKIKFKLLTGIYYTLNQIAQYVFHTYLKTNLNLAKFNQLKLTKLTTT